MSWPLWLALVVGYLALGGASVAVTWASVGHDHKLPDEEVGALLLIAALWPLWWTVVTATALLWRGPVAAGNWLRKKLKW